MPGSIYFSPSRDFVFVRIKISRCEDAFPVWAMHPLTARILHQQQPHFVHQISTISTRKKPKGPCLGIYLEFSLLMTYLRIIGFAHVCTHHAPPYAPRLPTCTGSPLHLHRRTWHLGLSLVPKTSGFSP